MKAKCAGERKETLSLTLNVLQLVLRQLDCAEADCGGKISRRRPKRGNGVLNTRPKDSHAD